MLTLALLLSMAADPFWVAKSPQQWTEAELAQMFADSPWGALAQSPGGAAQGPPAPVYVATAGPMEQAERERERRVRLRRPPGDSASPDPLAEEYRAWLEENRASQIVLAVRVQDLGAFADEREVRRMEDGCVMRLGRRRVRLSGHFPPSAADPYLRLAFPRQVQANDKIVTFELYLPGVAIPFRTVEFSLSKMTVHGKIEI
jgi:hypothetical protein